MKHQPHTTCLCESGNTYARCCESYHTGTALPPTAEALMRSRYSAYVLRLEGYLLRTWHASTRPSELDLSADEMKWLGLTIKNSQSTADTATVEFIARYRIGGGRAERLHEVSQFVRENGAWFYVDGQFESA